MITSEWDETDGGLHVKRKDRDKTVPSREVAEAYYSAGHFERAIAEYEEGLRLDPGSVECQAGLGMCYWALDLHE